MIGPTYREILMRTDTGTAAGSTQLRCEVPQGIGHMPGGAATAWVNPLSYRHLKAQREAVNPPRPVGWTCDRGLAPYLFDVGDRLIDLAPEMRAIAGSRLAIDAEIACPRSAVRMDGEQFDAAILALVANAVAAGGRNIHVRSHTAGARVWTLIGDDRRNANSLQMLLAPGSANESDFCATAFRPVHDFVRKAHGHLLVRAQPGAGACFALILPTVLSVAGDAPFSQPKEKNHAQDRQSVAA